MHLSREILKQGIIDKNLVSDYQNIDHQLTANGFDVRLAAIIEIENGGKLAVEKQHNVQPELGKAIILKDFEDRLNEYKLKEKIVVENGTIRLKSLKPYFVITCEKVNIPSNLMLHITPRTSLFRLTQTLLGTSFGEAGYTGYLTFMLFPVLDSEIELGARIAQLSFSELKGESNYEKQKETNYQGGKLF